MFQPKLIGTAVLFFLLGACAHAPRTLRPAQAFVHRQSVEDGKLATLKRAGLGYDPELGLTLPPSSQVERSGEARTGVIETPFPFIELTPSFEAATPDGTWVEVETRVRVRGVWLPAVSSGPWTRSPAGYPNRRHSVQQVTPAPLALAVDTVQLTEPATAYELIVRLHADGAAQAPHVRALAAAFTSPGPAELSRIGDPHAYGKVLTVPPRSQRMYPAGEAWCSPTSVSMVLAYFSERLGRPALNVSVPATAEGVRDGRELIAGNWIFNTAFASSVDGGALHATVARLSGLGAVERLVAAGFPVVIGVAFNAGELSGAPMAATDGHLLVIKGFTAEGDVVVNEPNAPNEAAVERVYRREELARAWARSRGTAYVVWPVGARLPTGVFEEAP